MVSRVASVRLHAPRGLRLGIDHFSSTGDALPILDPFWHRAPSVEPCSSPSLGLRAAATAVCAMDLLPCIAASAEQSGGW
jgi:hypothetical protein